jgi:large subunit ribosomal protein L23
MEVNIYAVIKGPWVTSKAYTLNQVARKLVLEVHPQANKPMVAEALKKLFNVEVDTIGIVLAKGKRRRSGRHEVYGRLRKKAIVTLKKGYSADLTGWAPTGPAQQST